MFVKQSEPLLRLFGRRQLWRFLSATPAACEQLVRMSINGRQVQVPAHFSLLEACKSIGVFVPTLCNHPRLPATGTCRLCLVQVSTANPDNPFKLVPSCVAKVSEGLSVLTDSPEVRSSVKSNLELLRAKHPNVCMTCDANGRCEFQDLIYQYGVEQKYGLSVSHHEWEVDEGEDKEDEMMPDESSNAISRDMAKCVSCGRCVAACGLVQNMNVLGFTGRGVERKPSTLAKMDLDSTQCIECGQCTSYCPTGAITEKDHLHGVMEELASKKRILIAQTAPAVRVAIGEEIDRESGEIHTGEMVAALRFLGFDYVFDTDFTADLTIMEEGSELLERLNSGGPFPMFTSCCPAWVTMVEKSYPHLIDHLSTARSPQQMLGSLVKTYFAQKLGVDKKDLCMVSIMPCTAKKHESRRDEFQGDVDFVLTTRELGHLLRVKHVPVNSLKPSEFDRPLGMSSGAATLFGVTGGVMEAAIRTAQAVCGLNPDDILPLGGLSAVRGLEGVKAAKVKLRKKSGEVVDVRIGVVHGSARVRHLLEAMEKKEEHFDFIEVMSCPGGCIGGGGQPKSKNANILKKRMDAIYNADQRPKSN
eukprot:TRINITY_DN3483_c0_g1_i1.p1 TRINITY_DN3483_c0_g1~~TRINITY_DN3483_c0_g1_i1.p1  ORF type:complete len:588 (-),score=152.61 TRINITY_DN3483_c0_g1_i1:376-2139(-)